MKTETGVVTAHPLVYAWMQVKTVMKTWLYCKKNGVPCNQWFGVYEKDSDIILAQTGCLPGAHERANFISMIENDEVRIVWGKESEKSRLKPFSLS